MVIHWIFSNPSHRWGNQGTGSKWPATRARCLGLSTCPWPIGSPKSNPITSQHKRHRWPPFAQMIKPKPLTSSGRSGWHLPLPHLPPWDIPACSVQPQGLCTASSTCLGGLRLLHSPQRFPQLLGPALISPAKVPPYFLSHHPVCHLHSTF